ncbi:MAG: hypothetical protein IAE81_15070 [Caldilineaceae bacterium]|nr:hypothetical protein [Caldilineaceae bacterium]
METDTDGTGGRNGAPPRLARRHCREASDTAGDLSQGSLSLQSGTSNPLVFDAGPLMVLAKLNLLHLLKQLYGTVLFTESVYREVVDNGMRQGYPDAVPLFHYFQQEGWQPTPAPPLSLSILTAPLDRGEQESIMLAADRGGRLLIDEIVIIYSFVAEIHIFKHSTRRKLECLTN